jgi:hypothetical protein
MFVKDGHASIHTHTLQGFPEARMSRPTVPEIPKGSRVTVPGIPMPKRGDAVLPPPKAPRRASLMLGTSTRYSSKTVEPEQF